MIGRHYLSIVRLHKSLLKYSNALKSLSFRERNVAGTCKVVLKYMQDYARNAAKRKPAADVQLTAKPRLR